MKWEEIDNAKISIKLLIVVVILVLGYKNKNKETVGKLVFPIIATLILLNVGITFFN